MMTEANVLACPNCGSNQHITGLETQVTCAFCGSTIIVPESLRAASAPAASRLVLDSKPIRINPSLVGGLLALFIGTTAAPGLIGGAIACVVPLIITVGIFAVMCAGLFAMPSIRDAIQHLFR